MFPSFEIDYNICDYCSEENNWKLEVKNILRSEFPDDYEKSLIGLPANHPFWALQEEVYSKYRVKCLTFTYDNIEVSLCKKHLEQFVRQL